MMVESEDLDLSIVCIPLTAKTPIGLSQNIQLLTGVCFDYLIAKAISIITTYKRQNKLNLREFLTHLTGSKIESDPTRLKKRRLQEKAEIKFESKNLPILNKLGINENGIIFKTSNASPILLTNEVPQLINIIKYLIELKTKNTIPISEQIVNKLNKLESISEPELKLKNMRIYSRLRKLFITNLEIADIEIADSNYNVLISLFFMIVKLNDYFDSSKIIELLEFIQILILLNFGSQISSWNTNNNKVYINLINQFKNKNRIKKEVAKYNPMFVKKPPNKSLQHLLYYLIHLVVKISNVISIKKQMDLKLRNLQAFLILNSNTSLLKLFKLIN